MTQQEITKEEIWKLNIGGLHPMNDITAAVYPAMDEYAKQMALLFFEHERSVPPEEMSSNYDFFLTTLQQKQK